MNRYTIFGCIFWLTLALLRAVTSWSDCTRQGRVWFLPNVLHVVWNSSLSSTFMQASMEAPCAVLLHTTITNTTSVKTILICFMLNYSIDCIITGLVGNVVKSPTSISLLHRGYLDRNVIDSPAFVIEIYRCWRHISLVLNFSLREMHVLIRSL